jgi:hypothetical protein
MTYDPYRQQDPYENPYRVHNDINAFDHTAGVGGVLLLGALLLAAIGGFIYYGGGDHATVANNELRPPITQPNDAVRPARPETTGSANVEPGDRAAGARQQ